MALHNVDKGSADRSSPSPNTHDKIIDTSGRMAHGTLSTQFISPGGNNLNGVGQPNIASIGQFVQTGIIVCNYTSSAENIFAVPHGLQYAPLPTGVLANTTVTGISNNGSTVVPLPFYLGLQIAGGNIYFNQYAAVMTDPTNVYVYMVNATGATGQFVVTYYLYKQPGA